jgi:macrophage erythroblast attacher
LADLFLTTHHLLFCIPTRPLLNISLTAGLSALKTPACHSQYISPSSGLFSNKSMSPSAEAGNFSPSLSETDMVMQMTPVCPICSFELNELARPLPFAHHSKSLVENDPVVLPNGRIYGRERLIRLNEKLGTQKGYLRDPVEPDKVFEWSHLRKVYIT